MPKGDQTQKMALFVSERGFSETDMYATVHHIVNCGQKIKPILFFRRLQYVGILSTINQIIFSTKKDAPIMEASFSHLN